MVNQLTWTSKVQSKVELNNGQRMPRIGFGTWQLENGTEAERAVSIALEVGYRLIDTAKIYGNEASVGRAIRNSDVSRSDIFLTTKLWSDELGYESGLRAFEASLEQLGQESIDLYLIHWPVSEARHDAWRALQKIYAEGRAKSIGVSNYSIEQLEEILKRFDVVPAVNQIEFHLYNYAKQRPLLEFCQKQGIVVEAYSPLAQARRMDNMTIEEIADQHNKSAAQVMLRWCLQHDTVPIPKSSSETRIKDNLAVFDFELSAQEMDTLDSLSL